MGSWYNVNGYMHLVQYINKSLLNIITRIETSNLHNIISPETIIQYFKAHKFTKWFGNFPFSILQNLAYLKVLLARSQKK